jgi:hypothetical protein
LRIVLGIAPRQQGRASFFGRARSRASLRISASIVFLRSMRSRSRTRFSSSRAPSSMRCFQAKSWEGIGQPAVPHGKRSCRLHGLLNQSTFSVTDQRRRRCTEVMTSTRRNGSSALLVVRRHP